MDSERFDKAGLPGRRTAGRTSLAARCSGHQAMRPVQKPMQRSLVGVVCAWSEAAIKQIEGCQTNGSESDNPVLEVVKFDTNQKVVCAVSSPISANTNIARAGFDVAVGGPTSPIEGSDNKPMDADMGTQELGAVTYSSGKADVPCYAEI